MKTALTLLVICITSIALAEDFKTSKGKEYKDATISRVEPDGIVLKTKSGISKVYFSELPKEVQERFHYDAQAVFRNQQEAMSRETKAREQLNRRTSPVTGDTETTVDGNFVQTSGLPGTFKKLLVTPCQFGLKNYYGETYLIQIDYFGPQWLSLQGDLYMNMDGKRDWMPMWQLRPPKRDVWEKLTPDEFHERLTYITDRTQIERIANATNVLMQVQGHVLTFSPENIAAFRIFLDGTTTNKSNFDKAFPPIPGL